MIGACFLAMGIPTVSAEPDLVLEHRGRWNIAVKAVYSTSPVNFMDRVSEGARQALETPCDYAMVIVGISNVLRHDEFLPLISLEHDIWGYFSDTSAANQAISQARRSFEQVLREESPVRLLMAQKDPRFRGVLLLAQTVCEVDGNPTLLTGVTLHDRTGLFGAASVHGPEHDLSKRYFEIVRDYISS